MNSFLCVRHFRMTKIKKNEHNVLLNMIKWVSEPLKSSGMEPMDFLPIVSCKRMEGLGTIVVFTF